MKQHQRQQEQRRRPVRLRRRAAVASTGQTGQCANGSIGEDDVVVADTDGMKRAGHGRHESLCVS